MRSGDAVATDHFKYKYDRDGNRLYKDNAQSAAYSEMYHSNGATAGYDNLNQMTEYRRGPLSDANADGVGCRGARLRLRSW